MDLTTKKKVITTPCADIYVDDDKICYEIFVKKITTVEAARKHNQLLQEHLPDYLPTYSVVDIRNLKETTKEVRSYFGSAEVKEFTAATALIVGSGLSKVVGNLFMKFSRPLFPTKLFSNEEKAKAWLMAKRDANQA